MTEKENEIIKKLSFLIPKMSEAKKEYFLGIADGMGLMIKTKNPDKETAV